MPVQALASLRVDFNFENPCYVVKLASNAGQPDASKHLLAAALSDNSIKVYQQSLADVRHVQDLKGHHGTITDICMPRTTSTQNIVTCSKDGSVRVWDARQSVAALRYDVRGDELMSCTCTETVLTAGGNGNVYFWDRRTNAQLHCLEDTHMDIVTTMQYHPDHQHMFFSASDDGLVAAFDLTNGINEDDAWVGAMNIHNSPEEIGFYGPNLGNLWCRSASETLHLWNWGRAVQDDDAAEEVAHITNAREQLTMASGPALSSIGEQIDYLGSCRYESCSDKLYVSAGSNSGSLAIFPVGPQATANSMFGPPCEVLARGHTELVRTVLFQDDLVVTGGEDARICVWGDTDVLEERLLACTSTAPVRAKNILKPEARHSPY